MELYAAVAKHNAGQTFLARDPEGEPASLLYLVWDMKRAYHLLGGGLPASRSLDTYSALIWEAIREASLRGLTYDFEGSMIERISKSFREFGGTPELYFRIRKVYSPEVVHAEAETRIASIKQGGGIS